MMGQQMILKDLVVEFEKEQIQNIYIYQENAGKQFGNKQGTCKETTSELFLIADYR